MPLQVGNVVGGDGDEFPAVFAQLIEQIDIIAAARDVVEVDFFVFECRHGAVREPSSACFRVGESTRSRTDILSGSVHATANALRTPTYLVIGLGRRKINPNELG